MLEIAIGAPIQIPFAFLIQKAESVRNADDVEERWMGGTLTTPQHDREDQFMTAATVEGALDFKPYLEYGRWTAEHYKPLISIGIPSSIVHKGNGVWYTEGRLFPDIPGGKGDCIRWSNHYWDLARAFKKGNFNRSLGLSADGSIAELSPCGRHIMKAVIVNAGVCEVPMNPGCSDLQAIRKAFSISDKCECGHCEPGNRAFKALTSTSTTATSLVKEDLEGAAVSSIDIDKILQKLAEHWNVTIPEAKNRLKDFLQQLKKKEAKDGRSSEAA